MSATEFHIEKLRFRHCWEVLGALNAPAAQSLMAGHRFRTARLLFAHRLGGPSAALFHGETLLAVGGITGVVPGGGEAWSVHHHAIGQLQLGFGFVRFCRRQLWEWIAVGRYHRVHATIPWPAGKAFADWLRLLGFIPETRLAEADAERHDVAVWTILTKRPQGHVPLAFQPPGRGSRVPLGRTA